MFTDVPVKIFNNEVGTAVINDDGSMVLTVGPSEVGTIVLDGFQRGGYVGFHINPQPAPPTQQARMAGDEEQPGDPGEPAEEPETVGV